MRVLHVIPSLSASQGGPSRAVLSMAQELSARGVDIEIATTDDDGFGRSNETPYTERVRGQGLLIRFFPLTLTFYKVSLQFARWIRVHASDYDLIHVHALFSFCPVVAARAARRSGVPYIVRPLGTLERWGLAQRRPLLKRVSLRLIESSVLRHAAAVHFTSERERDEAGDLRLGYEGVVIPLGLDDPGGADPTLLLKKFRLAPDRRRVLFLSRLDPKKNVESLLRAFRLVLAALPDTDLIVAGDGDPAYVDGLRTLAHSLGVESHTTWTGHIDGTLKQSAFAAAHVFALPSHSENFGIAVVEALAAGLPCVLGKGVAIADAVATHGAGRAVDLAPEAVAAALIDLVIDEPSRLRASLAARTLARERWSADAMGDALAGLYSRLVKPSTARPLAR